MNLSEEFKSRQDINRPISAACPTDRLMSIKDHEPNTNTFFITLRYLKHEHTADRALLVMMIYKWISILVKPY